MERLHDFDDWEILFRSVQGDGEAFPLLFERYEGRVHAVCERLLGDVDSARDATQEVFIKLFRSAANLQPRGKLFTWLYRIAVNHCLNQLRRRRLVQWLSLSENRQPGAREEQGLEWEPLDTSADPERVLELRERWQQTRKALEKLPPGQRAVLVLARFEGLAYREIAEVLGISVGAVESRLVRAMKRLLEAQEDELRRVSSKREAGAP